MCALAALLFQELPQLPGLLVGPGALLLKLLVQAFHVCLKRSMCLLCGLNIKQQFSAFILQPEGVIMQPCFISATWCAQVWSVTNHIPFTLPNLGMEKN